MTGSTKKKEESESKRTEVKKLCEENIQDWAFFLEKSGFNRVIKCSGEKKLDFFLKSSQE